MNFTINLKLDNETLSFDIDLSASKHISDFLQGGKLYEPDITLFLLRVLRQGDLFIDVGAHVGYFSMLGARLVGDNGAVISIEPEDNNMKCIRNHIALNNLSNVTAIQKPASDKIEMRRFFINSDNDGGHALWDPGIFPGNERSKAKPQFQIMQTTTIDEVLRHANLSNRLKIIKIDTEGAEKSVLEGAAVILDKYRPQFIICELHEFGLQHFGSSQDDLRSFMRKFNYACFIPSSSGNLPKLIPDGVCIKSKVYLNILFAQPESLSKYWPVEFINT